MGDIEKMIVSSLVYPYPHICQSECHSLLGTAPHFPIFRHTLIITLTGLKPAQSSTSKIRLLLPTPALLCHKVRAPKECIKATITP